MNRESSSLSPPIGSFVRCVHRLMAGNTREWLSGRASPCQGEGRGFDPRLPLQVYLSTGPDALRPYCAF
jgi:hypothetical protein